MFHVQPFLLRRVQRKCSCYSKHFLEHVAVYLNRVVDISRCAGNTSCANHRSTILEWIISTILPLPPPPPPPASNGSFRSSVSLCSRRSIELDASDLYQLARAKSVTRGKRKCVPICSLAELIFARLHH